MAVDGSSSPRLNELSAMHETWLRKGGAQLHKAVSFAVSGLQVSTEEADVGFTTSSPLATGETVVSVPSALLLNPTVVAASAVGARIRAAAAAAGLAEPSANAIFTMRYCIGLADRSDEYYQYFRSLPRRDPTTVSWPDALRRKLVGTSLGNATDRAEMVLRHSTEELAMAVVAAGLCPPDAVSWERRSWARGMFESRKFLFTDPTSQRPVHPGAA